MPIILAANSALSSSFLSRSACAPSSSLTFDSANEGMQRRDGQFDAQPDAKETERVAEEVLASNERPGPAERWLVTWKGLGTVLIFVNNTLPQPATSPS